MIYIQINEYPGGGCSTPVARTVASNVFIIHRVVGLLEEKTAVAMNFGPRVQAPRCACSQYLSGNGLDHGPVIGSQKSEEGKEKDTVAIWSSDLDRR